jgi:UDP-N-acetylmuramate-alanine ligase
MVRVSDEAIRPGEQQFLLKDEAGHLIRATLRVPGKMNICNTVGAAALSLALGASAEAVRKAVQSFTGIWRRFEQISDKDGVLVISDYGHHPTAIRATLEAARSFYPGRRIILCFQPHQHNRTRELFLDFVPAFDLADVLILVEIYDVPGRKTAQDEHISSQDLYDAIRHHDADRLCQRSLEFAPTPEDALPDRKSTRHGMSTVKRHSMDQTNAMDGTSHGNQEDVQELGPQPPLLKELIIIRFLKQWTPHCYA